MYQPASNILNKQDSLYKIFPFSRADSNNNLNSSQQNGLKRKEELLKSKQNGEIIQNRKYNKDEDHSKNETMIVKAVLSEEGNKDVEEEKLSSFAKRFKRVAWYNFILTVSIALSLWKGALVYSNISEAKVKQLEVLDDKAYYESEWSKQLKAEKEQRKRKTVVFTYSSKFWRKLKKNTRQLRKAIRLFQLKFSEFRQNLYSNTKKALRVIPVFDPLGNLILWWDFFNFLFGIFLYVYLPFTVSFEDDGSGILRTKAPLWDIVVIFLILDILKNCNTAIYVKGELIKEHLQICKNYIVSFDLILDIFTMISAINLLEISYLKAFFLLRIFYQQSLIEKFKDALSMSEKSIAIIDLLKLFATVLYLCHVVACVWHKMGQLEQEYSSAGWIVKYDYSDENTFTLYVNSYFYAIIMMSSVKGNIQPTTNTEKILSTILAFGACVLFGYTITSITIILRNINTKRDNFNALLQRVNKYMRQYNVDANYQSRARKYVEYVKDSSLDEKRSSQSVLNCLSKQLRDDIFIDIYSQSLRKIPFIATNFSKDCLKVLALKMTSQFYASDEVIVDCQKTGDPSLFILVEGEVQEFFYPHQEPSAPSNNLKLLSTKTKGQVLCEYEFFSQCQKPSKLAKSKGVSELHVLRLKDFTDVLQSFPEELEHYITIKDSIIFYRQMNKIGLECILCNQDNHVELECPRTFYGSRKIALRRKLGAAPKTQFKKILGFHRKTTKLQYHSLLLNKTIQNEIHFYLNQDPQLNQEQQKRVSKKMNKKERKMLHVLDKYNQHLMQNVEKEFILNVISPENAQCNDDDMCQLILINRADKMPSNGGLTSTKNISGSNSSNILDVDDHGKQDNSPISDSKDSHDPLFKNYSNKAQNLIENPNKLNYFQSINNNILGLAIPAPEKPSDRLKSNQNDLDPIINLTQKRVNSFKRYNSQRKTISASSCDQQLNIKDITPPTLEESEEIKLQTLDEKKKPIGRLEPLFNLKTPISEFMNPTIVLEKTKSNDDTNYEEDMLEDQKERVIQRQPITLAISKIAEFEIYFPHNNFSNVLKYEAESTRIGNSAFHNQLRKSKHEKSRIVSTK